MKKKDIILIVGVVAIIVLVALVLKPSSSAKFDLPMALSGSEVELTKIDYVSYKEKIDNNDVFIVIIERTGCGYCEMYMPIVEEAVKDLAIPVYYIDTSDLSSEEFNDLGTSNSYLKRNQWGTPTTLFMSGSTVIDSIGGYVEKETFLDFINKNVLLEETEVSE